MFVVDVETGGLDAVVNPLLSIGAIDFNNPDNRFYGVCGAKKTQVVTKEALEVNGFTEKELANEITVKTLLEQFFDWVRTYSDGDFTIAGENPSFDRDFIAYNAKVEGLKNPFGHRTIDMHSLAYADILGNNESVPIEDRKNKLNADVIFKYLGMPEEPRPHLASNGALWECEAFYRLILKKSVFKEFEAYPL